MQIRKALGRMASAALALVLLTLAVPCAAAAEEER